MPRLDEFADRLAKFGGKAIDDIDTTRDKPVPVQDNGFHPMEFASKIDELVERVNQYILNAPEVRRTSFRSHSVVLEPGQFQTISEDIRPDKWFVLTDASAATVVGVFPSSGQPVSPDMFTLGPAQSMTVPGINQYLGLTNLSRTTRTTVTVIALINLELDYDPPTSILQTAEPFSTLAEDDTIAASANRTYTLDVSNYSSVAVSLSSSQNHTIFFRGSVTADGSAVPLYNGTTALSVSNANPGGRSFIIDVRGLRIFGIQVINNSTTDPTSIDITVQRKR